MCLVLKFHHLFFFFTSFASVCFCKCMFCQACVFATITFAKCYFIFFFKFILVISTFFFCTMVVLVKEARLVVVVDDLDFGIKDVTFD